MQVGKFTIHPSPIKSPSLAGKAEKPGKTDDMGDLEDVFAKATNKLEESKKVQGAFVVNIFQMESPQFLNIKDISSQFNGPAAV